MDSSETNAVFRAYAADHLQEAIRTLSVDSEYPFRVDPARFQILR